MFQPSDPDVEAYEAFEFYWAARCPEKFHLKA